jgi:hypothetical protein
MTPPDEPDPSPDEQPTDSRGRLARMADRAADSLRAQQANRPIAKLNAGYAKVSQSFAGTNFAVYADRIETPKGTHPLTRAVHAEVETGGGFAKRRDRRELYLLVEGDDWSVTHQCDRDRGDKVRRFAQAVNQAVRQLPEATDPSDVQPAATPDPAETLKKLAELRDDGLLTQKEFETKKTELLSRM